MANNFGTGARRVDLVPLSRRPAASRPWLRGFDAWSPPISSNFFNETPLARCYVWRTTQGGRSRAFLQFHVCLRIYYTHLHHTSTQYHAFYTAEPCCAHTYAHIYIYAHTAKCCLGPPRATTFGAHRREGIVQSHMHSTLQPAPAPAHQPKPHALHHLHTRYRATHAYAYYTMPSGGPCITRTVTASTHCTHKHMPHD